jgi:hypothetical protein
MEFRKFCSYNDIGNLQSQDLFSQLGIMDIFPYIFQDDEIRPIGGITSSAAINNLCMKTQKRRSFYEEKGYFANVGNINVSWHFSS